MNWKTLKKTVCGSALALPLAATAQLTIDQFTIAGGGGSSSAGGYTLSGTIGQADAGGPSSGGNYSLTGGFWASVIAVQAPGAPWLTISYSGDHAIVSWPPTAAGWTLQTNSNLAVGVWGNYVGPVINNSATNSIRAGNLFFRLKR